MFLWFLLISISFFVHQIFCEGALPPCCFPLELVHLLQNPQGVRFWCRQQQPLWAGESGDDSGDDDDDDGDDEGGVMMIVVMVMTMVNIMMPITGVP